MQTTNFFNMTEYEMQKLSNLIAEKVIRGLAQDDRFIKKLIKAMPKQKRLLNSTQVAERLGISKWQVRKIAGYLGATKANAKGDTDCRKYGHLMFEEEGLLERYKEYLRTK